MTAFQVQFFTVSPFDSGWGVEIRAFSSLRGGSLVASVSKTELLKCKDQKTAELAARFLADKKGMTFVPSGSSVIVAGPIGNCFVPMELTADGGVMGAGTALSSHSEVMKQVKEVAERRGLPWVGDSNGNEPSTSVAIPIVIGI